MTLYPRTGGGGRGEEGEGRLADRIQHDVNFANTAAAAAEPYDAVKSCNCCQRTRGGESACLWGGGGGDGVENLD